MRNLSWLLIAALSMSCSILETSPEDKALEAKASTIPVATTITVTELSQYQELGPISCQKDTTYFSNGSADENCRNDLKREAARLGGDLVVSESRDLAKCPTGDHICVYMHGRAFRKAGTQK